MRRYPDWVHHELMNWSRWCWQGSYPHPLPPQTCASIERQYVRFREENTTDEAKPIQPNESHALIVDGVWKALPTLPRMVMRAEYPQRSAYDWGHGRAGVARLMRVSLSEYEAGLIVGVGRVMDAFEGGR